VRTTGRLLRAALMRPHRLRGLRHLRLAIHVRHGAASGAGNARVGTRARVARGCEVAPSEPAEGVSAHRPALLWLRWSHGNVSPCLSITCAYKHRCVFARVDLRDRNLEEQSDLHVQTLRGRRAVARAGAG
jgi:hypothetical protein